MNEQLIQQLVATRAAIGAAAWLMPRLSGRLFGLDPDANPQAAYLGRLFGVRDVALGIGLRTRAAAPSASNGYGSGSRATSPTRRRGCWPGRRARSQARDGAGDRNCADGRGDGCRGDARRGADGSGHMTQRRIAIAGALLVGLAGCGSSSSSSSSSSATSAACYRASVNKLCAAYNQSVKRAPEEHHRQHPGPDHARELGAERARPGEVRDAAELDGAAPSTNGPRPSRQSSANVSKLLDALKSGDTTELRSLASEGTKLNAKGNAQAQALGLPSCAENATPSG